MRKPRDVRNSIIKETGVYLPGSCGNIDEVLSQTGELPLRNKPGGGYGALGGATNIRAIEEKREERQMTVCNGHK